MDWYVFHPRGVVNFHPLSTTETREKQGPYVSSWLRKRFYYVLTFKDYKYFILKVYFILLVEMESFLREISKEGVDSV